MRELSFWRAARLRRGACAVLVVWVSASLWMEPFSERLENVRVDEGRRIARVVADFVFMDEGEEHPGTLGLHLVQDRDAWKIVAILFSYDER